MMRQSCFLAILAPIALLGAAFQMAAAFPDESPPLRKPPEPKDGDVDVRYWGTVTEMTKTSITIQFDNRKEQKPKRFLLSETLAAGKYAIVGRLKPGFTFRSTVSPVEMYRLMDVKVGDWVTIRYACLDGVDICDNISITKRPGGQVPPLPAEAESLMDPEKFRKAKFPEVQWRPDPRSPYIPYHERMNAYWDLEDKGIPYPEKFGKKRRWPVAPTPREKKLPGPLISP